MGAQDAIYATFADHFVPQTKWDTLKTNLIETADTSVINHVAASPEGGTLAGAQTTIDRLFSGATLSDIHRTLTSDGDEFATASLRRLAKGSPLALSCALKTIRAANDGILTNAFIREFRYSYRSQEQGDFIEGIRAQIIDRDFKPSWRHGSWPARLDTNRRHPMKIAFIGLGNMGAPMAVNLAAAGHDVVGVDPVASPDGLNMASSIKQACKDADVAITMLPNGPILRAVAAEIIPALPQDAVFIDCSTDGTLTFMVGGGGDAFATTKGLFDVMGQKAVHCGASGSGQAAKICNNMILGITMLGTCEAFAMADKLGLDRQAMFDVVSTSSGYSWTMNAYCPAPGVGPESPADNDYKPGFAAELMLKDLGLSQDAARACDAHTPMGALASALYDTFVKDAGEGRDFSGVLPWLVERGYKTGQP